MVPGDNIHPQPCLRGAREGLGLRGIGGGARIDTKSLGSCPQSHPLSPLPHLPTSESLLSPTRWRIQASLDGVISVDITYFLLSPESESLGKLLQLSVPSFFNCKMETVVAVTSSECY